MIKQLLLLVAVVFILTGGFVAYAQTRPTVKTTWEYTVVLISQPISIEKDLNQLGAQGWELVTINGYMQQGYFCVLKRPKSQ